MSWLSSEYIPIRVEWTLKDKGWKEYEKDASWVYPWCGLDWVTYYSQMIWKLSHDDTCDEEGWGKRQEAPSFLKTFDNNSKCEWEEKEGEYKCIGGHISFDHYFSTLL